MEKGIECGIRFSKSTLEQADSDFNYQLSLIMSQLEKSIYKQRLAYQNELSMSMAKSGDDYFSSKTIELYCSSKESSEISHEMEKGIECGIRIKQFALDLSDSAFKAYVVGCFPPFKSSILEQRKIFMETESEKSVEIDSVVKGVEFYCRAKSFCS